MRQPTRHMRGRKAAILLMSVGLLLVPAASLAAHDLFLRLQSFFVPSDADVRVYVLNGTFSESEANVARDRVHDLSVVAPTGITHPDLAGWREQGDTTVLSFRTGASGFVVAGGRTPRGERLPQYTTRTDSEGVARVPLDARGHWYIKFIHMVPVGRDSGVDYESKWANVTFEVR